MSKNQTEPIYYSFNQAVKFCTNYLENEDDLEIDRREVSHIINMIMNICGNKLNIQQQRINIDKEVQQKDPYLSKDLIDSVLMAEYTYLCMIGLITDPKFYNDNYKKYLN